MSSNFYDFMGAIDGLSSGYTVTTVEGEEAVTVGYETIPSAVFGWLGEAGEWAGAIAALLGLVD